MPRIVEISVFAFAGALGLGSGGPARAAAGGAAHIELYAEVQAARPELLLRDIARVDAPEPERRRSLERVPICYAPVPGSARQISREYVLLKLRQQHVDTSRVTLAGADVVHIVTVTFTFPAETIVATVREAMAEAMPWARDDVEIVPPRTMRDLTVQAEAPTLHVRFEPGAKFLGSTIAHVQVYAGDVLVHSAPYRFHIALYRKVYVAQANIPRGTLISPADVATERMDIARFGDRFLDDPDHVFGLQATRSIRPGTRLTPAMLGRPPVIGRGERVRVNVTGAQFQISGIGEAKEAGALGSIIRVDLPNRRRVHARVRGPGVVELLQ